MSGNRISLLMATAVAMVGLSVYFADTTNAAINRADRVGPMSGAASPDAAAAAFESMVPVLHHPRCMNCHSSGDFPRQGDDGHPHAMNVRRGTEGRGVTSQKCSTCHQDHNLAGQNMPPGAPDWHLPPPGTPMVWQGLSNRQLCELFKDRKQNGNRNVDQIVEHMNTPLVLWAWHPGEGRTPVAMSQSEFAAKVKVWAAGGAACPTN
jgi:cytochrome c5